MSYIVGVDIGGTFTDCVVLRTEGEGGEVRTRIGKALSNPPDFQTGFVAAMRAAAEMHGVGLERSAAW